MSIGRRAAFVALLSIASVASATTVGALSGGALEAALQSARAALPATHLTRAERARRAAISASLRVLGRSAPTLDSQMTLCARALLPLHRTALLSDVSIRDAASSMETISYADLKERRDALAEGVANLPAGPVHDRPNAALQKADSVIADAQSATDSWVAFVDLGKALNAVEKGEKLLFKSKWTQLSAGATPLRFPLARTGFKTVFGKYTGAWSLLYSLDASAGRHLLLGMANVVGPGTYAVLPDDGSYSEYDSARSGAESWGGLGGTSGTVTFTAWDPDHHRCAGSIDVVMTSNPSGFAPDVRITGTFSDGDMVINLLVPK